jgi:hypothetical protein
MAPECAASVERARTRKSRTRTAWIRWALCLVLVLSCQSSGQETAKSGSVGKGGRANPSDGNGIGGSCRRRSNPGSENPNEGSSGSDGNDSPSDGTGIGGNRRLSANPGIESPKLGRDGNEGSSSPNEGHGMAGSRNEHLDANEDPGGRERRYRSPGQHGSRRSHPAQHDLPNQVDRSALDHDGCAALGEDDP